MFYRITSASCLRTQSLAELKMNQNKSSVNLHHYCVLTLPLLVGGQLLSTLCCCATDWSQSRGAAATRATAARGSAKLAATYPGPFQEGVAVNNARSKHWRAVAAAVGVAILARCCHCVCLNTT